MNAPFPIQRLPSLVEILPTEKPSAPEPDYPSDPREPLRVHIGLLNGHWSLDSGHWSAQWARRSHASALSARHVVSVIAESGRVAYQILDTAVADHPSSDDR